MRKPRRKKRRLKEPPAPVPAEQDLNAECRALLAPDPEQRASERVSDDEASVEDPLDDGPED